MARPRHPDGHHEQLFRKAEQKGWTIRGGGNAHFQMFCPCEDRHIVTVSTTPKNPSVNLRVVIRTIRRMCWKETP